MTSSGDIWGAVLAQARLAAEAGEVPVGGVIVHNGRIIARAHNQVERLQDATAHVEMLLLKEAARLPRHQKFT